MSTLFRLRLNLRLLLLALCFSGQAAAVNEVTTFHYRTPESQTDPRYDYDRAVFQLALEKTRESHGDYRLLPTPPMNFPRAIRSIEENTYPNYFIKLSYEEKLAAKMGFAAFPIDLGIVGYRICFVAPDAEAKVQQATDPNELRTFTHGQGIGWSDVGILRYNGFPVVEIPNYASLFHMVAAGRFDLFCRGVNELDAEQRSFQHIQGLTVEQRLAFSYPLPRFLFTHRANQAAIERVEKGLHRAWEDGSLLALWKIHYSESIRQAKLDKRQIIALENPYLRKLDPAFKRYFINPLELRD